MDGGMECIGMESIGMESIGMESIGMDWYPMQWIQLHGSRRDGGGPRPGQSSREQKRSSLQSG